MSQVTGISSSSFLPRLAAFLAAGAVVVAHRVRGLVDRLTEAPEVDPTSQFTTREWADLPVYHPQCDENLP